MGFAPKNQPGINSPPKFSHILGGYTHSSAAKPLINATLYFKKEDFLEEQLVILGNLRVGTAFSLRRRKNQLDSLL